MAIVEGLIKPWAKHQSKESAAQVLKQSVKGADLAKEQAVKNHLSKINGALNGNGNGNGLRNGVRLQKIKQPRFTEVVDQENYRGLEDSPSNGQPTSALSRRFAASQRTLRGRHSTVYSWNIVRNAEINSLDDIKTWVSKKPEGSVEHFQDFGAAMKKLFPDKEGGENFVGFEDIYDKYEELGFTRRFDGDLYRLKRTGTFGARSDYAGGPRVTHQKMTDRNRTNRAAGERRNENIAWSTDEDKANFRALERERKAFNDNLRATSTRRVTATGGMILEHDIQQNSRYWTVYTNRKNSDASNVFNWNQPRLASHKGAIERHLAAIDGEPFYVKMNGTRDKYEIYHLDSDTLLTTIGIEDDYEAIIEGLLRDL